MKKKEKAEARKLRGKGWSVKKIAQKLDVSQSSVSLWVRDVPLTHEQKFELGTNNGSQKGGKNSSNARYYKNIRSQYQEEGRKKAKKKRLVHAMGCMLYWAEGSKGKNSLQFVNSDLDMMRFFAEFLRQEMGVQNEELTIYIRYHGNNGLSARQIETKWLDTLGLKRSNLRKTSMNQSVNHGKKKGKLPFGICTITVNSTKVLQHIFGAVKEYCAVDGAKWLN